jgi:hypothetical protein
MSGKGVRRRAMPYFGIALALFSLGLGSAAQKVTTSFQHDFDFCNQRR